MITTTIHQHCRKCGSQHIVKNGHNRSGSHQYLGKDCRAVGVLTPKHQYRPERREEILRAYQERPSMRGISRIFGVSRNALAAWIKKNSRRCRRSGRPCIQRSRTTGWTSMRSGRLSASGRGNAGCGRSCAVGRGRSLPSSLATTAKGPVAASGIGFRGRIGDASVSAISGRRMPPSFRSKPIGVSAKRRERRRIWNDGITRGVNA